MIVQKMFYHIVALREQNPSSWAGNYPHLFHFANRIKWPLKKKMAHYCCTVCNLRDIKTVHLSVNSTLEHSSFLLNLHFLWNLFEHYSFPWKRSLKAFSLQAPPAKSFEIFQFEIINKIVILFFPIFWIVLS